MQNLINFLENISLLEWLIITVVMVLIPTAIFLWKYLILQFRFANNLRRRVYFLKINGKHSLEIERNLLKDTRLFKVEDTIYEIGDDLRIFQQTGTHCLYVIGYDPNFSGYKGIIEKASQSNIPVIIFAEQGEIKETEHWEIFNSYIYCDVANTSSRLTVIILNTMYIV